MCFNFPFPFLAFLASRFSSFHSNYKQETGTVKKNETTKPRSSKNRSRSSSRSNKHRVIQVNEAEKLDLLAKLRAALNGIESSLKFSELDLATHLEDHDYLLDRATDDFLERCGLRIVEPNQTLKKINYEDDQISIKNAWSCCNPSIFKVRCGPSYRVNKFKAPASSQSIYETIAVDMYSSKEKLDSMTRFFKLGNTEREDSHPLPSIFIVNFMLPLSEPKVFSNDPNGPTVSFLFIMKLSEWARKNPEHPSVQLVSRFIRESGPNGSMRERLKIIVQVSNPEQMDLGKIEKGLYKQYNGLPFLYRTYNSRYHYGSGWFQADFDGHRSGYATRLARHSLLGLSEKIVANVGFLVESETDDEMPERILGCANVHRLECRKAQEFIKPVPVPFFAKPRKLTSSSLLSDAEEEGNRARGETEEFFRDALCGTE